MRFTSPPVSTGFARDSGDDRKAKSDGLLSETDPMLTRAVLIVAVVIVSGVLCSFARADGNLVDLELRSSQVTWEIGDVVEIGLYAVSTSGFPEIVRGMQVILEWDPQYLELAGLNNNGPYTWLFSSFFSDAGADRLNADCGPDVFCQPYTGLPYNDGDAYYQAGANFTTPALATPGGLLITTFRFNAVAETPLTTVQVPLAAGTSTQTQVFGDEPGSDITGTVGSVAVQLVVPHWGTLDMRAPGASCGVWPGDMVTVELHATGMEKPVNGVQALISYDEAVLQYVDVLLGDGAGSPWDTAAVVQEDESGGQITYAVVLLGTETQTDGVVARLLFVATEGLSSSLGTVSLESNVPPLSTKLTCAGTGITVIPALQGPAFIANVGDWNRDGIIDLADHARVPACLQGPGVTAIDDDCCRFDFDRDGDVDLRDFAEFAVVFAG